MPRTSVEPKLRVEVLVREERILISCGRAQNTIEWLIDQVSKHYGNQQAASRDWHVGSAYRHSSSNTVRDDSVKIANLRTESGALLPREYKLQEILNDGDVLHADVTSQSQEADNSSGEPTKEVAPGGCVNPRAVLQASTYVEGYGHPARVFAVAFSPVDSTLLASASDDSTAKIWRHDADRGSQAAAFLGHTDSVMCLSWSPDGTRLATGSADTSVQLWKPNIDLSEDGSKPASYDVELLASLKDHPEEVYAAHFLQSGAGEQMLTASTWIPYLWDIESGRSIAEGSFIPKDKEAAGAMPERWQDGHIFGLEPMPSNGPLAAATCSDGAVRFWRLAKGPKTLEPHAICEAHKSGMGSCCSWSSDGHKLASTATDGSVVVLDIRMLGKICWQTRLNKPAFNCQFLPSAAHTLAVCGGGPDITLLETSTAAANGEQRNLADVDALPYSIPTRASQQGDSLERGIMDLRVSSKPADLPKNDCQTSIASQSSLGPRSLLCIAASADGQYLAGSGQP